MTTLATASFLREATSPEALTRARRRLLTAHLDPTSANTPTPGSLTDEQLRLLAASDWVPPRIAALGANTIATADAITRALLAESVRESLERRLTTERPHGTYDDTRAGHDAFSRGVVKDYDHGNHHLARATIRVADPDLVTCAGLSALDVPDTDATIIDELARASDPNPIASVLADAALLDLDRYATGRGLRYSRVGTALMLTAPNEQRLADAIDAVAVSSKTRPVTAHAQVTPSTQVRNLLRASCDRLTKRQQERLCETFTADEAHISVDVAYLHRASARGLPPSHTHPRPTPGRSSHPAPTSLSHPLNRSPRGEPYASGRTHSTPTSIPVEQATAPRKPSTDIIELGRRTARGYRNPTSYQLRILIAGGLDASTHTQL